MKRKREIMEKRSELRSAIEELSMLAKGHQPSAGDNLDGSAHIHTPTKPFLHVCTLILQVLGQFLCFSVAHVLSVSDMLVF